MACCRLRSWLKLAARLVIYASEDGGNTWYMDREVALAPGSQPGGPVPFSLQADTWRAADPAVSGLTVFNEGGDSGAPAALDTTGLPAGTVNLDFVSPDQGWALVQENLCSGDKIQGYQPEATPFTCSIKTRLFWTEDGGLQWVEISPSN